MRTQVQVVILALLAATLGAGVFSLVTQPSPGGVEVVLPSATPVPVLRVFVNGAVREPEMYLVDRSDRLEQVVAMAGGLTGDADPVRLNLALAVVDQAHYYIPKVGETLPTPPSAPPLINVNLASALELQALPGIAELKAAEIVAYREANGPFDLVEDLLKVDGIGSKTLEALRERITVT